MVKYYDVERQKIRKVGYKDIFKGINKIVIISIVLSVISILSYVVYKYNVNEFNDLVIKIILLMFIIPFIFLFLIIKTMKGTKEIEKNASLVNENEEKGYFIKIGKEVKEHKRNILQTAKKGNIKQELLIKESAYCTHWIVMGTTGSGKTVFVQTIVKQILEVGGGFIFIDGKGTQKMIKTFKAICYNFNRHKDFFVLNFADPFKSNSINIFTLKKEQLQELFNLMLVTGKDAYWEGKATSLINNLLHFITALQKIGIAIDIQQVNNIDTFKDLKTRSFKNMNFSILESYLNVKTLIDIIKMFKRIYKNSPEFENIFIKASNQERNDVKINAYEGLLSWLNQQSNLDPNYLLETEYEKILKDNDDPFYNAGSAISYFTPILTQFTKDYANIFNRDEYDINIEDIILNHRICYIALPGTKSNSTKSLLAKFIQANFIATYETLKNSKPLTIPFTIFYDEINSYLIDIEGVGNLPSQTREQKLAFFYMFQTDLGKMDDGKGLEKEQIFGNVNNYVILKLKSPELTKMLQDRFPKKRVLIEKEAKYYKGINSGDKDTLELDEKPYFDAEDLEKLDAGECYIKVADKCYQGIGDYVEEPYYYQNDGTKEVDLIIKKSKTPEMII